MKLLHTLNVADRDLDRVQQRVDSAFDKVATTFVGTSHIVAATLGASDTQVFHGLGQMPRGFIVVWLNAAATVYEGTPSTNYASYINLKASTSVTASVLFF